MKPRVISKPKGATGDRFCQILCNCDEERVQIEILNASQNYTCYDLQTLVGMPGRLILVQ